MPLRNVETTQWLLLWRRCISRFLILFYTLLFQKDWMLAFTNTHDAWNNQPRNNSQLQTEASHKTRRWLKTDIYRWFDFQQHRTHAAFADVERNSAPEEEAKPFQCNWTLTHPWVPDTQDATLLTEVALNFLSTEWHTSGLDSAFVFFSITSRILWQFHLAFQDKDRDAEQPFQDSRGSSQFCKHCTFPAFPF